MAAALRQRVRQLLTSYYNKVTHQIISRFLKDLHLESYKIDYHYENFVTLYKRLKPLATGVNDFPFFIVLHSLHCRASYSRNKLFGDLGKLNISTCSNRNNYQNENF